ncbi:hypothetical protein GCM10022247_56730 [Allokutzneria multivorans]|uniref:Uncharacterized protein n=1 Tax=Allokutzneria multivorans TaxID=1142134 RepID=A0ABP7TE76_9PSEU
MSGQAREEDRTYHGIDHPDGQAAARIFVEVSQYGPTERELAHQDGRLRLRELHAFDEDRGGGFGWGYNGGGPSRAASAVLADALDEPQERYDFPTSVDRVADRLRKDFCEDVLSQLCGEWRLRRGAVLRWARGWYAQQGITPLPSALAALPPIGHRRMR